MATERLNSREKSISSEALREMMPKLCRNVHNISLYIKYVFIAVAHMQLNGKNENSNLSLAISLQIVLLKLFI